MIHNNFPQSEGLATSTRDGLMSSEDKCKLDSIDRDYQNIENEIDKVKTTANEGKNIAIEAREIAIGKTTALVFDTVAKLDEWLADPANITNLQIGTQFLIRDTEVPDYWWDGTQKQESEVQKVDLSDYLTKTGNSGNTTVEFTKASKLEPITSNSTLKALMSIISKSIEQTITNTNYIGTDNISALGTTITSAINKLNSDKANNNHASTTSTYGLGTTEKYGHVKIINNLNSSSYSNGNVLSAYQGYLLGSGSARDNTKLPLTGGTLTGSFFVGSGKSGYNDGIAGAYIGTDGTMHLSSGSTPYIGFHVKNSTFMTKLIPSEISSNVSITLPSISGTAMLSEYANGYWGFKSPSGDSDWIRTTVNGIIPYKSGGASSLGTESWPFSTVYATTLYGSLSGNASSANKLNTNAGSATQPVYFSNGVPVACSYTLGKSVPSDAVFTDTNTWRPLGTTADTACAGNDSRLSDARPASDVYAWAKASSKPSYTYSEVGAAAASHTHSQYLTAHQDISGKANVSETGYSLGVSGTTVSLKNKAGTVLSSIKTQDTNTWRPLGTTADTACAGNDSRLSDARPASDVYAWAKASSKPSYTYSEVGAAASSHTHKYAGSSSEGGDATAALKVWTQSHPGEWYINSSWDGNNFITTAKSTNTSLGDLPIYVALSGNSNKFAGWSMRLNHNMSDTWIPVLSSNNVDYIMKKELVSSVFSLSGTTLTITTN